MKYNEIRKIYPWIEEFFALVAGQINAGATEDMAIHYIERQVRQKIRAEHQQATINKLAQFARAVANNRKSNVSEFQAKSPALKLDNCRYCGSIEMTGSVCIWCHNKSAE